MSCSCIKGNYNFIANSLDKKTIIYQDISDWMNEVGYELPTEYTVTVTPPASSKSYPVVMKVGQLNRLTSTEVGVIRDGVYCFETESCGKKYTRSVAIYPLLDCCVRQLWATLEEDRYGEINEIERHLNLARNHAGMNNAQTSAKELKIARKLLENIKCDCNC